MTKKRRIMLTLLAVGIALSFLLVEGMTISWALYNENEVDKWKANVGVSTTLVTQQSREELASLRAEFLVKENAFEEEKADLQRAFWDTELARDKEGSDLREQIQSRDRALVEGEQKHRELNEQVGLQAGEIEHLKQVQETLLEQGQDSARSFQEESRKNGVLYSEVQRLTGELDSSRDGALRLWNRWIDLTATLSSHSQAEQRVDLLRGCLTQEKFVKKITLTPLYIVPQGVDFVEGALQEIDKRLAEAQCWVASQLGGVTFGVTKTELVPRDTHNLRFYQEPLLGDISSEFRHIVRELLPYAREDNPLLLFVESNNVVTRNPTGENWLGIAWSTSDVRQGTFMLVNSSIDSMGELETTIREIAHLLVGFGHSDNPKSALWAYQDDNALYPKSLIFTKEEIGKALATLE